MLLHAILGLSPVALAALIGICILGGSAEDALGIGIPLLTVPLTAPFMDLPAVMALLMVPIFATNFGQAVEGGGTKPRCCVSGRCCWQSSPARLPACIFWSASIAPC